MKKFLIIVLSIITVCLALTSCGGNEWDGFYQLDNVVESYGADSVFTIEIDDGKFEAITSDGTTSVILTGDCFQCGASQICLQPTKGVEKSGEAESEFEILEDDTLYLDYVDNKLSNDEMGYVFNKVDKNSVNSETEETTKEN